ncbi:DEAD/DEAH box helicase [Nocardioides mangrovi]|uniref:DEAD/DEAH box helicase n=1 Tax=Nocardioides mangrovi TaxID=2874580 RepID=A0ABS7UE80_9ACTN|nr:DEAD/DEAH box helicase [Nocardioides mangrovi]MBZ5739309.1 DEAD/DEAH box helicase [Nocardioides mangrovi]
MPFVPLTGPATFRAGDPPREGVVEFSDQRRTVALPIRAAIPVLTRARNREDLHPTVGLLSGAALLGMRLVAAGKFAPGPTASGEAPRWQVSGLDADDEDRIEMLARAQRDDERVVRDLIDAIADAMPRQPPVEVPDRTPKGPSRPSFEQRLQQRLARHRRVEVGDLPQLVRLSIRVEADEEELVAGAVRLVPQVHDEQNPLHLCDLASLWVDDPEQHGFGDRARTHATIALRAAADAWPVLDRLLELRVPDQLQLDTDELVSLLDGGVEALRDRGVDVMWPRSLGRDLSAAATLDRARTPGSAGGAREEPLNEPMLATDQVFAFRWQLALHGDPLTEEEMDLLAASATPLMRLRGNWTVVDPAIARKARKRLLRTVRPAEAVAAALTGVVQVGTAEQQEQVVVGASLLRVREQLVGAATREPVPPPEALAATLRDYQRHGLTWLAELTSLGLGACLADDMGLGKTITLIALHLHRHERGATGPTLVVCPASLLGNWEDEVHRFAPGTPVTRFHGSARDLDGVGDGFVLTTYGTLQRDAERLAGVAWDLVVADEAQHVKNPRTATARALRGIPSAARVALTGTPVENNLTELWAILDWAIPGLLGSRNAFRKVWAGPIESGREPTKARQFADLIGPFLLRRRKSDPGIAPELPPKTETDHRVGLTREQVVLYESFVRDVMARIERADEDARRGLVLTLLTGLKQICNHPAQFLKQGATRLSGRSQKIDLLDELLGTVLAEDGAALVFTQYVAMARLLESHLARAGIPHQLLHGGTPVREREAMVRRFQAGEAPVFLLSLKAGGTGLNLTRADHVIHVDRWWNPAVEEQATDRAYRIGQTRPVQVHRMITRGTVEERIAEMLGRKRALADAVLGRGETALTELSNDELRDLVTLRPDARDD